jgi:hypothetical protein
METFGDRWWSSQGGDVGVRFAFILVFLALVVWQSSHPSSSMYVVMMVKVTMDK